MLSNLAEQLTMGNLIKVLVEALIDYFYHILLIALLQKLLLNLISHAQSSVGYP